MSKSSPLLMLLGTEGDVIHNCTNADNSPSPRMREVFHQLTLKLAE